jgi:hydrogenase maturation protein HypF
VAHDLHPDFETTRYALKMPGVEKIAVQHHHAHVVSCMAEHSLEGTVIGLALDGSGYGNDGAVWGGEVLVADTAGFRRAGHIAYVPMPGGDAAVRAPWRMAVSYLYQAYEDGFRDLRLPMLDGIDSRAVQVTVEMIKRRVNSPLTSSLGRLFDGVAAMVGLRGCATFEGQAPMELEAVAGKAVAGRSGEYPCVIARDEKGLWQIDPKPMIQKLAEEVASGTPASRISRRFHATVISVFRDLCVAVGRETGVDRVVLSGGVFQNAIILGGITRALRKQGFKVFSHRRVPPNDGGLSLGQAVVAGTRG